MADNKDPAVSVCFSVRIDDDELGWFNTCEGLGLEVVIEQREEGGNNGFVWQLPTRIKYGNVKLSRPVGKDSAKLTAWLCSFASGVKRQTAIITAMTGDRDVVATWASTASSRCAGPAPASTPTAPRSPWRPSSSPTTDSCPARAARRRGGQN